MRAPLAFRMRPQKLEDIYGQDHLLGPQGFLRHCIEADTLVSMIFYGKPGTGKTTIAEVLAKTLSCHIVKLNAVTSSKKDLETALTEAKLFPGTVLILDEVHRLNKDKQDILLPFLEDGTVTLIGATTSNPYIAINPAIRSRCHILEVHSLKEDDIIRGLRRALTTDETLKHFTMDEDALHVLAHRSGGDMRFALNYLEVLSLSCKDKVIHREEVEQIIRVPNVQMDKNDDEHYDSVSALQKSIRGSDVNAALYYLARLCIAGDLDSIERRLVVTAYEDIGLGNPAAVDRVHQAIETAKKVGFPEAIIPLGFAVVDLALSPKSKASCEAMHKAMDVAQKTPLPVLDYLKLTPVSTQEEDRYPYDRPDLWEKMQYLPEFLKNVEFYIPNFSSNYERLLNQNYARLKAQGRSSNLRALKAQKSK